MKKRFLLFIAAMLLMMPQVLKADGFPRYYELVTDASQLESGKYYLVVAIDVENIDYRMAYNGFDKDNSKGKAGKVVPNALYAQTGITPTAFSGIIDREKTGNHAIPLKMSVASETNGNKKWNFIDESVDANHQFIGVNASTSGDDQHYLIGENETNATNGTDAVKERFQWYITISTIGNKVGVAEIRNVHKVYYLKYDANSYGNEATSLFRVYTGEKYNVMLYKEMETVQATTSFTGHGTLYYSDKVLMVPEGVTAARTYTFNNTDNRVYSNKEYATEYLIPANSAVIFRGEKSTTYTFPVTTLHNPTRDDTNILKGFDAAGTTTSGTSDDSKYYFYKLTTQNHVESSVGFYWGATNGAPFTSAAHKAYLALLIDDAKNARSFLLNDIETPTSITPTTITQQPSPDGYVYDLTGRRFSTTQSLPKGIYISNGKKFVVK